VKVAGSPLVLTLTQFLEQASDGILRAGIEAGVCFLRFFTRQAARQAGSRDGPRLLEALTQTSPLSVVMAERLQALRDWPEKGGGGGGRAAVMADLTLERF